MRNSARLMLASLACICSLAYLAPAIADDDPATTPWAPLQPATKSHSIPGASWNMHPVTNASTKVYETYVDRTGCKTLKDSSPSFTGGSFIIGKGYSGDNTFTSGHPIELNCPAGTVMVTTTSQTSGFVGEGFGVGGGQISNNDTADCCPVKHRWVAPDVKA